MELDSLEFYSWQCLSIEFGDNIQLHLVIKDPSDMDIMLKYLIFETQTMDG